MPSQTWRLAPSDLGGLLKDWRFWATEGVIVCLAITHNVLEGAPFMATFGNLSFLPVALLWLPIWYSARAFGFPGSVVIALSVFVATVPNFVFWHQGSNRVAEVSEVSVMVFAGLLVGYLVDQSKIARLRAQLFADHALRSREEERKEIARDLHDQTIQALVTVIRETDNVRLFNRELPDSANDSLLAVRGQIEHVIADLRKHIATLRPSVLDDIGLLPSVKQIIAGYAARTGVTTHIEVIGEEPPLTSEQKTCLFRIAREALLNAERHSSAKHVTSTLTFNSTEVILRIQDDGVGFEVPPTPGGLALSGRFGLLGMLEYAELLGGRLKVDSAPGNGTSVTFIMPLEGRDNRLRKVLGSV